MVEACDRVLAPHGSMCIELGDTYAGSATTKGGWKEGEEGFKQNYRDRVHDGVSKVGIYNLDGYTPPGGEGWPLAKSLSLIPELFRLTLVYGTNPLTGRTTERWRLRNVVRWVRPNPPVGALGDKFRPATSELMVFCKSAKRYFDLDAVREPYSEAFLEAAGKGATQHFKYHRQFSPGTKQLHPGGGAPPLDWWNIPPGGYVTWPERVNPGEYVGGTLYIESAGCPLHAGLSDLVATAPHGEPADTPSSHSSDSDANPALRRRAGSVPTDQPTAPTLWDGSSDSPDPEPPPVAKRRSKTSNRTVPVPGSTTPDTASGRTPDRTGDIPGGPLSDVPHLGSPENRTSEVRQAFLALESYARTGHKPPELGTCSCAFYVLDNDSTSHYAMYPYGSSDGTKTGSKKDRSKERWAGQVPHDKATGRDGGTGAQNPNGAPPLDWWEIPPGGYQGSHYAVFPPELCIKPIKAMCPEKVCRQCGEPSRRITEPTGAYAQVLGKGFSDHTRDDLGRSHTARAGVGAQTERGTTRKNALRDELGASLVRTVETTGWTDCGHDDYRPGMVLDPFGGSGTTALVATGHGRDCILIDLDERNYDLALQRVGPFILERGEL